MEKDFRINEVAGLTGLTHNYIYTCLKRMPEIFRGLVSTGQHNARIFGRGAVEIFSRVAYLKTERLWSIAQIKDFLLRGGLTSDPWATPAGTFAEAVSEAPEESGPPSEKPLPVADYHPDMSALIELITEKDRYIRELHLALEEKDRLIFHKDREISEQRRRSDEIVMELTGQLSRLLRGLGPYPEAGHPSSGAISRQPATGDQSFERDRFSQVTPAACVDSTALEHLGGDYLESPIFEAVTGASQAREADLDPPPGPRQSRRKSAFNSADQDTGTGRFEGGTRE